MPAPQIVGLTADSMSQSSSALHAPLISHCCPRGSTRSQVLFRCTAVHPLLPSIA